ncbi:MAG: DUF177 domain-containing protein [Rikenellaceae bacterium]
MSQQNSYSIDFKGLEFGEHQFAFPISKALFEPYEACEVLDGEGEVKIELTRSETMLQLEIAVDGAVEVECDRCLEPCKIEVGFDTELIVKFTDDEEILKEGGSDAEGDGEVMWLSSTEQSLNLAHYIYESIILALPYQRAHEEGECNTEITKHFTTVTGEEWDKIEQQKEQEAEEADKTTMPKSELDKLAALKAKLEGEGSK